MGNAAAASPVQSVEPGQDRYAPLDPCLSERSFAVNAQPSNPVTLIDLPVRVQIGYVDEFARLTPRAESPRPQNKSSPPVYLLTLRILV
jgi:hypothetical protein